MLISKISKTKEGDLIITNVTVMSEPSKPLTKKHKDGTTSEYCLLTCSFNVEDKNTGEITNLVVPAQRTIGKDIPEKDSIVTLYQRTVNDMNFFTISTSLPQTDNNTITSVLSKFM